MIARTTLTGVVLSLVACGSVTGSATTELHGMDGRSVEVVAMDDTCESGACRDAVEVSGDGTWTRIATGGDDQGGLDPTAAARIIDLVDDRWDEVTAQPFVAAVVCPGDGESELTLRFTAVPTGPDAHLADAIALTTSSCEHHWPNDFVDELRTAWEAAGVPWPSP